MSWFWWIITGNLAVAFSRILQKKQMTGLEGYSSTFSIFYQVFTGISLIIFATALGYGFPDLSLAPLHWLIAAVTFGSAGMLLFKAFATSEVSSVSVLSTTRIIWTMTIAILFLGEILTPEIILGTVVIVSGIIVLLYKRGMKLTSGSIYALLAAMMFGIGFANEPFLLEYYDPIPLIAYEFILGSFVMVALNWKATMKLKYVVMKSSAPSLTLGILVYAFTGVAGIFAYQLGGDLVLIAPLSQLGRVFTVILGIVLLNEKDNLLRKIVGIALAIAGALIITML